MKTLYLTSNSSSTTIDPEANEVDNYEDHSASRWDISQIFYIDEPMHVVYGAGTKHEEIDVKKGDILIKFQGNKYIKKNLVVVKSKDWFANIKFKNEAIQAEKEEWATRQCENCESENTEA